MKQIIKDVMIANWLWVAITIAVGCGFHVDMNGNWVGGQAMWQHMLIVALAIYALALLAMPFTMGLMWNKILKIK